MYRIQGPSTSGLSKDRGGPISLISDNESDGDFLDDDDDDGELCCICHKRRSDGLSNCDFITITKWGKCDSCSHWTHLIYCAQGRIQDFKLGGGDALKRIAPSGGRRENFWGISCEKTRFYAKKSYSFQLRREARKMLGYFV